MISNKEIRRIVKRYLGENQISEEVIECIKRDCVKYIDDICKLLSDDFNENNRYRETAKLPKMKRLQVIEYKNLLTRTNKQNVDFNMGVVGENNRDTTISKKQKIEVV